MTLLLISADALDDVWETQSCNCFSIITDTVLFANTMCELRALSFFGDTPQDLERLDGIVALWGVEQEIVVDNDVATEDAEEQCGCCCHSWPIGLWDVSVRSCVCVCGSVCVFACVCVRVCVCACAFAR